MKEIKNQRGFALIEFAIALPLLIFLLYALGSVSLSAWKISREQVADYVLETEAQEIIDRITADARAAYLVKINKETSIKNFDTVIFICHTNKVGTNDDINSFYNTYSQRIYSVDNATGKPFHIYFNRQENLKPRNRRNNPLTGDNSYGDTVVQELSFSENLLSKKILHVTLELQSMRTNQSVKFSTAVFMPACEEIIYHGRIVYPEENADEE